jgi:methylmalonyl-CoA carboxyltransferase large subunit
MSTENLLFLPLVLIAAWFVAAAAARSIARREIEKLRAEMEGRTAAAVPVPAAAARAAEPPPSEELDDEILAVLSAAVAAFLGKTARIRRARLLSPFEPSNAWAQQGRVYVQASHNLGAR